jgi:hypothetical protein
MAQFNAEFWEIPTQSAYLDNLPAERALWFETEEDREKRYAMQDFFRSVLPVVNDLIDAQLTARQREVLRLYYFCNKTQEDDRAQGSCADSFGPGHLAHTLHPGVVRGVMGAE